MDRRLSRERRSVSNDRRLTRAAERRAVSTDRPSRCVDDRRLSRERRSVSNDRRLTMLRSESICPSSQSALPIFGSQPVLSTKSSSTKFDVVIEEPSVLNSSRLISLGKPDHQTVSLRPTVNFDKTLSTLLASDETDPSSAERFTQQKILVADWLSCGSCFELLGGLRPIWNCGGAALVAMATIVGANRSSANFDNDSIR
uniref:Uncharacterized protein n=1 Tax=Macrostomum lignano TaxID=282301 RepID=A0A1I8FC25_9PLAT